MKLMKLFTNKGVCVLIAILVVYSASLLSQTLDQARSLYLKGEYAKALPVFEREITKKPSDMSLNQWYGVCLYETGEKEKSIKYLNTAHKKGILGSLPYLAEYTLNNGDLNLAKEYVEKGIGNKKMQKKDQERLQKVSEELETWLRMAQNATHIEVIDSIVLEKKAFLSAYHLSKDLGTLHYLSDFFEGELNSYQTVFQNQLENKICFSEKKKNTIHELKSMDKLLDAWTNKQTLAGGVNDEGSNITPYIMSDGITIYFASDRAEGLGGYDLYISRLNSNTNSYLTPENLGVPFNSAANDYLLVYDELKKVGWFASDRFQSGNEVVVYTFLMNSSSEKVDLTASEDPNMISLRSIKSTWVKGKDYAPMIALARGTTKREAILVKDFELPIMNGVTYTRYADFKNKDSEKLYREYLLLEKNLQKIQAELDSKRVQYHSGNDALKSNLSTEILSLEQECELFRDKPNTILIEIRNNEIQSLGKNK